MFHSAPFESWDGAESIFTFADSPGVLYICVLLVAAVVVATVWQSVRHENHSFEKAENGD